MGEAAALEALKERCAELGLTLEEALSEKGRELQARAFLLAIPNSTLRPERIPEYLTLIGRLSTEDLVERVSMARRGPRLSDSEIISLEERQHLRCAVCGVYLDKGSRPHLDHIVPVALGGKSEPGNYQLLCHRCNLGKSSLLDWTLGIPFQARVVTNRLRYCVLAKSGGKCQFGHCSGTSRTSELRPVPRIAIHKGGQYIFDNLTVLCKEHADKRDQQLHRQALNTLRLSKISRVLRIRL